MNNNHELYEYKYHQTLNELITEWEKEQQEKRNNINCWRRYNPTLTEAINDWKKSFLRK